MKRLMLLIAAAAVAAGALIASPAYAQSGPFANCTEAYAAGRANIPKSDPAYAPHLDGTGPGEPDGIACENPPWGSGPAPTTAPPVTAGGSKAPATTKKATTPTTAKPMTGVHATPRFTG